jgi:hypothetical protein
MFMTCPECGLSIRLVAPHMLLERCPRGFVRRRQIVEMRLSPRLGKRPSAPAVRLRHGGG